MSDPSASDPVAAIAARYSGDAATYREHSAPVTLPLGRRLLAELPLAEARRILDLGTGVGSLLPSIREGSPSATVVGADRTEGMVRLAPDPFARLVADAGRLPFDDGTFDVIVMVFMLFHVPDPIGALRGVRRSLRPGGAVGVATWGGVADYEALRVWTEELDAAGATRDDPAPARHDLMDTPEKLAALLTEAGFASIRTEVVPAPDTMSLEEFVTRRTAMGFCRARLDSLDPERRTAFLARARRRLERLPEEAFVDREPAVLAWGEAPS